MLNVLKPSAVQEARPAEKPYKLADGGGLHLLVKSAGKYWRFDYRHGGKRKTLALGVYPTVSLEAARKAHFTARRLLEIDGMDPVTVLTRRVR